MQKHLIYLIIIIVFNPLNLLITCKTGINGNSKRDHLNKPPDQHLIVNTRLSVHIDSIITESALLLNDSLIGSREYFLRQLDSAADAINSRVQCKKDQIKKLEEIKNCVFNVWQIKFNPEQNRLQNILPNQVLLEKQGSCLGISLLYLLLGEKINLPLYGVLAPGHFFVRYDDGSKILNIETLRNGEYMSDSWYRERYRIEDTTYYNLSNLSLSGILAALRYNIGNYYLANNLYNQALNQYDLAIKLNPGYLETQGNRAIALDGKGDTEAALKILLRLKKTCPELAHISKNLGALYLKKKDYKRALYEYRLAQHKAPTDAEIMYCSGVCYFYCGKNKEAEDIINNLLILRPEHIDAKILLSAIKSNQ